MRSSYPVVENVFVIDSGLYEGRVIFPKYSAGAKIYQDVEARVVGGLKGNMNPLVKGYAGDDRNSEYVVINSLRIPGYTTKVVDVPVEVKKLVEEYNELYPKFALNQRDDSELDLELQKKVKDLSLKLNRYFE